jgi:osmotically-inducible protein OsmY
MKSKWLIMLGLLLGTGVGVAAEVSTFHAYVDSDLCARLMLGPITAARIACSQNTNKEGSDPVLIRLRDNAVFSVNKTKMLKGHVGKLAEVSGEAKSKSGTIKLQSVKPEELASIPPGDPARKLLDPEMIRAKGSAKVFEKIRHELAMMPYVTVYDFISFNLVGNEVILTGWTVRATNRDEAYSRTKSVEGVETIVNNIEVLPLGAADNQIRAGARTNLQRMLSRYFWTNGSDIKIVVKNGNIILLGTVATKEDSDIANIQCKTVPFAFHVFNLLRVDSSANNKT